MSRRASKSRQYRRLQDQKNTYDRVLVVCEGSKTEPFYLNEIRIEKRYNKTLVHIRECPKGTDSLQIVNYAEQLFLQGNQHEEIGKKCFDHIFAVFDRDNHPGYNNALKKAATLNLKLRNNNDEPVPFTAIPSNPCFELWLLLHYIDVPTLIPCSDVEVELVRNYSGFDKSNTDNYANTKNLLTDAHRRAKRLATSSSPTSNTNPYTNVNILVDTLLNLDK